MKEKLIVPENEIMRQQEFMKLVEKLENRPQTSTLSPWAAR